MDSVVCPSPQTASESKSFDSCPICKYGISMRNTTKFKQCKFCGTKMHNGCCRSLECYCKFCMTRHTSLQTVCPECAIKREYIELTCCKRLLCKEGVRSTGFMKCSECGLSSCCSAYAPAREANKAQLSNKKFKQWIPDFKTYFDKLTYKSCAIMGCESMICSHCCYNRFDGITYACKECVAKHGLYEVLKGSDEFAPGGTEALKCAERFKSFTG